MKIKQVKQDILNQWESMGLFIWRWAGPGKWAGSPRWYLTFLKKLLEKYNVFIWEVNQSA